MKRFLLFLLFAVSLLPFSLLAQNPATASAIADKQDAEEHYKRMATDVESMMAANVALQKKVSALENELQKVREDLSQLRSSNKDNGTADSLKKLTEKIQEVDRKREADKDLILAEFAKLGKTLASAPPPRTPSKPIVSESTGPEKGFTHPIEPNETLGKIVSDYNAAFKAKGMKTITQKQVMDANPNVNWNKLKIGQKIFVPAPPEK